MGNTRPRVPDYSPDLFVNREEAIHLVLNKVQGVLRSQPGYPERKRIIVFWGYRGAGKTWLLRRLAETELPRNPDTCSVYINLERFAGKSRESAIQEIIDDIVEAAKRHWKGKPGDAIPRPPSPVPLDWLTEYLQGAVTRSLASHVLVLLVDFVYEADPELLELLEKHVLGPLVANPSAVIVMAGRGQARPFKDPTLRLQVEDYELKPFDNAEYTQAQLQKQREGAVPYAKEIHEATLGYPLANVVIPYPLDRATPAEMKEMIDVLLEPIRNSDGSWPIERTYLEALCVLRTFDEERIPVLLNAYDADLAPRGGWTCAKVSEVLRALVKTSLVRWNSEESGWWIVDQAIRHLLEEYLRVVDVERWKCCHEKAIALYKDWVARYSEETPRWKAEMQHHESRLRRATA